MKICRFTTLEDARPKVGVVRDDVVQEAFVWDDFVLARGPRGFSDLTHDGKQHQLDAVHLLAPITPSKGIGIGLNYQSHADEANMAVPEEPMVFGMGANAVADPGAPIIYPAWTSKLDYEGELAVVIGREASHVRAAEAMDYVAGYTCCNDISARDYQMRNNWVFGKGADGALPAGPFLVTPDGITDPHDLMLTTRVNGQVRQSSRTEMIWRIPWLIEYVTSAVRLLPGDVVSTGTPAGVGMLSDGGLLQPGDVVEVEIENIGVLRNAVVAAQPPAGGAPHDGRDQVATG